MSFIKIFIIISYLCGTCYYANSKDLNKVKNISFTKENKIEILLSSSSNFKSFILENPNRLVIDIENSTLDKNYIPKLSSFISNFRSRKDDKFLRLVFDLKEKIKIQNSIFNEKEKKIIITLSLENSIDFINQKINEFEVQNFKVVNEEGSTKYSKKILTKQTENLSTKQTPKNKIPIIVIDAGHGGKDPGTIGNFARSKEKNITLSYAKEFGRQLLRTKRYKVYLTRDTDNFIPLRKRVEIARKKKADLFISLHVNAILDNDVSGFSIYTLSEKSSDKQAEILAQKENRADIIDGIDFSHESYDIMKTLIDLSQRKSKNESAEFANLVIKSVKNANIEILQNTHRFAGFAVLTAPDITSTLVELGYLSNKKEEALLNSISYRKKIIASLVEAVNDYYNNN